MEFFSKKTNFDFMGKRRLAIILSSVLILASIASLVVRGLNFGIDFTGGTLIEVGYQQDIDLEPVRERLEQGGYGDATIQRFGTPRDILIRIAPHEDVTNEKISNDVFALLEADETNKPELRRVEFVGPQVGDELTEDGGLAMLYALFPATVTGGLAGVDAELQRRWLVDIIDEDLPVFSARINRLLKSEGRWVNFGSLAFSSPEQARRYSPEEVKAIVLRVDSGGGSAFASELIRQEFVLAREAGKKVVVGIMDFRFLGGSLAAGTGEKIHLAADYALRHKFPLILVCASGGARMHEGIVSLMQMAKTVAARAKLRDAGAPFISVLLRAMFSCWFGVYFSPSTWKPRASASGFSWS